MTCDKGVKDIQCGKNRLFYKWYWENWISICQTVKLDPYLIPCKKINSECIEDLKLKFLEENIGGKLQDTGFCNNFMDVTPKAQAKYIQFPARLT